MNSQRQSATSVDSGQLIPLIYNGVMEPRPWTTFAEALRDLTGAMAVAIVLNPGAVGDPEHSVLVTEPGSDIDWDGLNVAYAERYLLNDPMGNHKVRPGEIRSLEDFRTWAYYTDFLKPAGIEYSVRMGVGEPEGLQCWVAIAKSAPQGPISVAETALLQSLLPHFEQALATFSRLMRSQIEKKLYQQVIERLALGNILLDAKKRVISVNRVAQKLLGQSAGIAIQGETLKLADRLDNERLQVAIDRAVMLSATGGLVTPAVLRLPREGLALLVAGIDHTDYCETERSPHVIVHINPLRISRGEHELAIPEDLLGHLFNLSRRESRLLCHILRGDALRDAAMVMGISEKTARNHLNSIYDKTGVHRQVDLVRLVYQSGVILADPPEARA